jgi:hypothetical protein
VGERGKGVFSLQPWGLNNNKNVKYFTLIISSKFHWKLRPWNNKFSDIQYYARHLSF